METTFPGDNHYSHSMYKNKGNKHENKPQSSSSNIVDLNQELL